MDRVASSIALHGLRPISTASISVSKFLIEMFTTLSELLQDKLVQSDLLKEPNFWKVVILLKDFDIVRII